MSIKYGQFCPIAKAAEILGERWTLLIVRELLLGTTRFNDFQRALSQISPSLLTKRLNQLIDHELVVKKQSGGQRHSEYFLTAAGKELGPIVVGIGEWGARWARGQMSDDELDVEMLMYDIRRRIDPANLPDGMTVMRFVFGGLVTFAHWWIVIDGDGKELCVDNPGHEVDVTITTDVRTLAEIWAGDTRADQARKEGRLQVDGSPVLVRTLSGWLPQGGLAHIRPVSEDGAACRS